MRKQRKIYSFNGLAGCVTQWRNRTTGTLVGVYHGEQSGMECDAEYPWLTVCEKHGTLVCHRSLTVAKATRDPRDFCDFCREEA